jgi:hypothetical protein
MAPTEREILQARLILAKADQQVKKKTSKARSGKENKVVKVVTKGKSEKAKKKQPPAIKCVFLVRFIFAS